MQEILSMPDMEYQHYNYLLSRYADLSEGLRTNAGLQRPLEKQLALDEKRHDVHIRLKNAATQLGKSEDDVWLDILSAQGNLKEYHIDAPLIRLPMIGVYFSHGPDTHTIARPREKTSLDETASYARIRNFHSISDALGTVIATVMPPPKGTENQQTEKIRGDKAAIEKWDNKPYYMILYSDATHDAYGTRSQPLHDLRRHRMRNVALEFNLNLCDVYDLSGHNNFGEHSAFGIEVPAEQVKDIAKTLHDNRQKYWLTPQEEADPFTVLYSHEEIATFDEQELIFSLFHTQHRAVEANTWQTWHNVLLVYTMLINIGWRPQYQNPYESYWKLGRQQGTHAHEINPTERIETTIAQLQEKNPLLAATMQKHMKSVYTFHAGFY